jgi:GTP-binding protein EngB required for normal cell division
MDQILAHSGLIERFVNLFNPFNPNYGLPRKSFNLIVLLAGVAIFLGTISSENEKYILISGSANNETNKQALLKQIDHKFDEFKLIDQADLNQNDKSDFLNKCNQIKNDLKMILLIENLNLKPDNLLNDIIVLKKCFDINELKEKIFFVFTFSSIKELSELQKHISRFNSLFNLLTVLDKEAFVENKVWMLSENKIDLENMNETINRYLKQNKNFIGKSWIKIKFFFHSIFFPSQEPKKKLVFIGQVGNGKSSTGNKLCGEGVFTVGNDINRVTTEIEKAYCADYALVDCPGFGDPANEAFFLTKFLEFKTDFLQLAPVDAFILVIKFGQDISNSFLDASQQFIKAFGTTGLKSLMILCIQSSEKRFYSESEFEKIILDSDGYLFLLEKNKNMNVPYCKWDNFKEYKDQENCFKKNLNKLSAYTHDDTQFAFNLIEKEIEVLNKKIK